MANIRAGSPEFRASLAAALVETRELRAYSALIRQRLFETKQAPAETLDRARATHAAVCVHLASLGTATSGAVSSKASNAVLQALAVAGRAESDLDEIADDLIAAYRTAVAAGDDDMRTLLAGALMQIGRHLATQVGPKAAGVIMN